MTLTSRLSHTPLLQRTAVALAVAAGCASASAALPAFTFDPSAVGLAGPSFTGDNILISDYSTVMTEADGDFTETGFLSISALQLVGSTFTPTGLNSEYGLYIAFTGAGTSTVIGDPVVTPTFGSFTSLDYTLYGYNGAATFGFSGNTPTESASNEVMLATGSLISGSVAAFPSGDGETFIPSASAQLTFNVAAGAEGFFQAPVPFYDLAFTAFTNTTSQVEVFDGGFRIRQGGGSINFDSATAPIPEPETYAMLLAGLGAIAFVARRRRRL